VKIFRQIMTLANRHDVWNSSLAQTGFKQPNLFSTRVLAHWITAILLFATIKRSGWVREKERKGSRSEQRACTLRHVIAGGTTSGYRKCQKAQSFTAIYFSFLLSLFPFPLLTFSLSLSLSLSLCFSLYQRLTAI